MRIQRKGDERGGRGGGGGEEESGREGETGSGRDAEECSISAERKGVESRGGGGKRAQRMAANLPHPSQDAAMSTRIWYTEKRTHTCLAYSCGICLILAIFNVF